LLVSRLERNWRTWAYLVMSHMVKDPPVGCGWCIAKTGCSARIRANSGAGLIGSSGSRCERGQDSGSDEVVITNDNTSGRRKASGSTSHRASLDKEGSPGHVGFRRGTCK
jgi:hypothetical protein